jgi:hypothetical protein
MMYLAPVARPNPKGAPSATAQSTVFSDPPKITQYSRSPSTRSLSVMQESPDSVHAAVDIAHAYLHHAVEHMCQSPPQVMSKPENMQNTKAARAPEQCKPNPKVQCDEAEIEDRYDTEG